MKDYEWFEVLFKRVRENNLYSDEELVEHQRALASIRKKLRPLRHQGRPLHQFNGKFSIARISEAERLFTEMGVKAPTKHALQLEADRWGVSSESVRSLWRRNNHDERAAAVKSVRRFDATLLPTKESLQKYLREKENNSPEVLSPFKT